MKHSLSSKAPQNQRPVGAGQLPVGWVFVELAEIAETSSGGTPSRTNPGNYNGTIPWIKSGNLKDGNVNEADEFISDLALRNSAAKLFPAGTLLIALYGATIGKLGILTIQAATNQAVCGIFLPQTIRSQFIFFFLIFHRRKLIELGQGGAQPNISQQIVRGIPLPLPPLTEQHRIVAKIEELFSELDAGEENLRRARRQLGVYRQSLLKQAFEGKLTEHWRKQNHHRLKSPEQLLKSIQAERQVRYQKQLKEWEREVDTKRMSEEDGKRPAKPREPEAPTRLSTEEIEELSKLPLGWYWMTLESLSSPEPRSVQSGPFGSSLKHDEFTDEGVLVIGIDNVQKGYFSPGSQNRISPDKYSELEKYTARPKDFLITIMATVGRCCRIPDEIETAIITKHVYRVSPNLGLIDPDYLVNAALGCPAIVLRIEKDKFGQTRPGLNGGFIKDLPVPLCSLLEQQEIVRILDEQFTAIEQNEREIDAALKRSAALRQSILKKAFTGQLVPQDPTDEPAAILLERIRKERENGEKPPKQPAKKKNSK